jgi:hypothetical protein
MGTILEYADSAQSDHEQDDFVLRVPTGICIKEDLFVALAVSGRFPDYFGYNWNALDECLCDLSWIPNKKVIILHSDVPLQNNPSDCRIYMEILQTSLNDWSNLPSSK